MGQENYLFPVEIFESLFLSAQCNDNLGSKNHSWCLKIALAERCLGGQGENQELVNILWAERIFGNHI